MAATRTPRADPSAYNADLYEDTIAVEDRHFWFQARNRAIAAVFDGLRPQLEPGFRVLEVGCGTGNVLRTLQHAADGGTVFGMDLHVEGLRFAKQRLDPALLVVGDAAHPPFAAAFDIVGVFDVIEHIDDDAGVLRDLRNLLKPGGRLLVTVPADPRLWSYFDEAAHHRRRYSAVELGRKLLAAGLRVEYLTPYMSVLHPLLWAGRRITALRNRASAYSGELIQADLRVRPVAGGVLGFILGRELRFIRKRRRLPFGASLLAIARRS